MPDIRIFVSCHKESYVPENTLLRKIRLGADIDGMSLSDTLRDNTGDNISEKNRIYCELTAQYWAWKNVEADYYGFFHYRRYLNFVQEYPAAGGAKGHKAAYYIFCESNKQNLSAFGIEEDRMTALIKRYDIVTVLPERSNSSAYEQYCQFHNKSDIDRMLEILKRKYPDAAKAAKEYMASKILYFMNMYIMKKQVFTQYMEWLFPLLEEFETETDFTEYSEQEQRVCAYLAERLFGIWYTIQKKTGIRCCELPYVLFDDTEPETVIKPVFGEDSVNLVLASNEAFSPYLAIMLQSVLAHAGKGRCYDIVILHSELTPDTQKEVAVLAAGRPEISIRFCNVKDKIRGIDFPVHHHFSKETFYRYFILDVMADYKKVLYLDADMIALCDVGELFDVDVGGYYAAAVKDMDVIGAYKAERDTEQYLKKQLGLVRPLEYFQAGVLLLNLELLRRELSVGKLVEKTLEYKWRMADQDVLNLFFQGRVKFLEQKYNVLMNWKYGGHSREERMSQTPARLWGEYKKAREEPYLIHYAGAWKPWNTPACDYAEQFWREARKSPFYERILYENFTGKKGSADCRDDRRIFLLRPTKIKIKVDMKKLNRFFPVGSRRRRFVRTICRGFL